MINRLAGHEQCDSQYSVRNNKVVNYHLLLDANVPQTRDSLQSSTPSQRT